MYSVTMFDGPSYLDVIATITEIFQAPSLQPVALNSFPSLVLLFLMEWNQFGCENTMENMGSHWFFLGAVVSMYRNAAVWCVMCFDPGIIHTNRTSKDCGVDGLKSNADAVKSYRTTYLIQSSLLAASLVWHKVPTFIKFMASGIFLGVDTTSVPTGHLVELVLSLASFQFTITEFQNFLCKCTDWYALDLVVSISADSSFLGSSGEPQPTMIFYGHHFNMSLLVKFYTPRARASILSAIYLAGMHSMGILRFFCGHVAPTSHNYKKLNMKRRVRSVIASVEEHDTVGKGSSSWASMQFM